ncbi:MAG TPA: DUF6785 family protein [Tepidisphaeraceae bacterium]|nr:DUF6785 family protein [Tepidisphaeraceae bacterium]
MRIVTPLSVGLGLLGVTAISAFTPFNNYVASNTDIIGSALPTGVVVLLLFTVIVNGLIHRAAPRYAASPGELGLAVGMMLVACGVAGVGLMRWLPPHLVQYYAMPVENTSFAEVVRTMDLPDWLWPNVSGATEAARASDPLVRDFIGRAPLMDPTLLDHVRAVPWAAWATPAATWGTFFALLFGAVIFMSLIFRRQWVDNERLPFPLATVYLSLIEPPAPGRALNRLLSSRAFWIAFGCVFVVHLLNGLSKYDPTHFPPLPLTYDLTGVLSEQPWTLTDWGLKRQTIYFTVIGVIYFADTRVALSLWGLYLAKQVYHVTAGASGAELTEPMQLDQIIGATVAFAGAILWIARRHLAEVVRQMVGRRRDGDSQGRYLPHALSGWGLVVCLVGLVAWLTLAGASVVGAVALVTMLMLIYLVLAKVVAETGLLYVLIPFDLRRPWAMVGQDLPGGLSGRTTLGSYFYASMFSGVLTHDLRQAMPAFVPQAIRVSDETGAAEGDRDGRAATASWRSRWPIVACLALAIVTAFVVSGASMLLAEYTYSTALDRVAESPFSIWSTVNMPRYMTYGPVADYLPPRLGPREPHDRLVHVGVGAAAVVALSALRLRFVGWPVHPVGFLLVHTWGIQVTWFSIFLGWLAKTLIIRLGGSDLFARAKPLFLGLIVGEASAAAFWLTASWIRIAMGLPYETIQLLPT